jgi:uncharacterized protein (TIGR03437 family)
LRGKLNALVAKFDPTQSGDASLVFSTYLGGSDLDTGLSVATDSSNRIYIRGGACSTDFPVTSNAYQPTSKGNCDAFLTELSADGQTMLYSTYLGGSGAEYGTDNEANLGPMPSAVPISWYSSDFGGSFFGAGLAVDSSGYVYVTGATRSTNFPVSTGAYQATNKGSLDAFIVKLDTTKSGAASLIYSTLLGGSGMDRARAVAVDATGVAYVLGETKSTDFPVTSDALQKTNGGGWDLFISAIGPDGKSLSYSTYLGGSNDEQGLYGLKLDGKGGLYIGSASKSSNYPTTAGAYQTSNKGGWDGVLTKLDLDTTPQITLAGIGNAANYVAGKVSPGEIIVVYGYNFGPAALAQLHYTNGVADTSLGNTSIYFDNVAAPMIYAVAGSPGVLSCVVPYAVKTSTQVQVSYNGVKGNTLTVPVVDSVPGIFSLNQSGTGAGAILNWPDYTVNGTSNRVAAGGYIMAYATGEGKTDLAADGQHVPLMGPYPSPLLKPWTATVGGQPAGVTYSGSAPDNIAGVFQVNVQIPTVLTTGVYDLVITTGTFSSTAGLTVAVK